MVARFIAQRVLTGEFLHWDLPITEDRYVRELSAPGVIEGTIDPVMVGRMHSDGLPLLSEWDTAIYVEVDGQIRKGGLLTNIEWEGSKLTLSAAGFSVYPTGIPFQGDYRPSNYPDPAAVIQYLWKYVQSFPDSDLGVQVVGDKTYMRVRESSKPLTMAWWEVRDCGEEINSLLATGPMDYIEEHTWNSQRTEVAHTIRLGFPRVGNRRHDLRFAEGENIALTPAYTADGLDYAQDIYGFGRGSGTGMVRARVAVPNGRVRRAATYFDKNLEKARLLVELNKEFQRRASIRDVQEVTVIDHPNAPIAGIEVGDDILITSDSPWLGHTRTWVRVLTIEESTTQRGRAILGVQRADAFRYAPNKSPNGKSIPIDLGTSVGEDS